MQEILIIKTGAAGDVVRTTTLLRVLDGNITWIIDEKNLPLLPDNIPSLKSIAISQLNTVDLFNKTFDLVLSLEEDPVCAGIAAKVQTKKRTGVFLMDGEIQYSDDAAGWFDMSLVSRKGRKEANRLKAENHLAFQHWLFKMIGRDFSGESYWIYRNTEVKRNSNLIGIEMRSGNTWPNKSWAGYQQLSQKLQREGFEIKTFSQRENIRDYLNDIAACSYIISGDSLPMHVALAYNIPSIGIFNCTPPDEIYDYGTLTKVASPFLKENLYDQQLNQKIINSISVEEVYHAFRESCVAK